MRCRHGLDYRMLQIDWNKHVKQNQLKQNFSTNVMISISISYIFRSFVAISVFALLCHFYLIDHTMYELVLLRLFECVILMTMWLFKNLPGQVYVRERLQLSVRKFIVHTGILSNNIRHPFRECFMIFWSMTICRDTLQWSEITLTREPFTELNLIQSLKLL